MPLPHPQHLLVCLPRIFGAGVHHLGIFRMMNSCSLFFFMLSSDRSFNPRSSSHDELNDELWSKSTQKPLVLIFSKTEKVPIYGTFPSGSGDVTRTHDTPGMNRML